VPDAGRRMIAATLSLDPPMNGGLHRFRLM
jgi:hypothetical protein